MISPKAEPIGNVSPYKRVELGAGPKKPEPKWVPRERTELFADMDAVLAGLPTIEDIYCG